MVVLACAVMRIRKAQTPYKIQCKGCVTIPEFPSSKINYSWNNYFLSHNDKNCTKHKVLRNNRININLYLFCIVVYTSAPTCDLNHVNKRLKLCCMST